MKIIARVVNDWRPVDAEVMDTLVKRGYMVSLHRDDVSCLWEVEVPEWRDYLSAVWHVYAKRSRGSEGVWPLRCKRVVEVCLDGKMYQVRYWVSNKGLLYGSIAV